MPKNKSSEFTEDDRRFMAAALTAGRKGLGCVEPNPMVGCVIVKNRRIVATGWHRKFGGPHAEIDALRQVRSKAAGATVYVTLEPCCHVGKTGPCSGALIEAKVGRVVIACRDPFPKVSGGGIKALGRAGIAVETGLMQSEAEALIAPFRMLVKERRPYVIAKWAQSLDGKIATRSGDSKWISNAKSRRIVHELRGRVDGIIVGLRTVRLDDPMLTARDVRPKRIAKRIVFDSRLQLSLKSKLVQTANAYPTMLMTTHAAKRANRTRCESLKKKGITVLACASKAERVSPTSALRHFSKMNMTNVLVEGGGSLIGSFNDAGFIDEAHVFTAPILVGGDGPTGCDGEGKNKVRDAVRGDIVKRKLIDGDQYAVIRFANRKSRMRQ